MQVQFNTGRKYTAKGQRIIATMKPDFSATFHDIDRMIDGELMLSEDLARRWFRDKQDAARILMSRYDAGDYKSTTRSWEDAFLITGCNSSSKWEA